MFDEAQELCEGRGGCPGLPVSYTGYIPYGLCGRKATFEEAQELFENRSERPELSVPKSPYGLCGRKATFEEAQELFENRGERLGSSSLTVLMAVLCGRKATLNLKLCHTELRSCVKVEMDVLGILSHTVRVVSVDVKQH